MVYLDNASTSYPKPQSVIEAVEKCLKKGANPGRGGHRLARYSSETIFKTREILARFLGASSSSNIIFTLNATDALNLALKGLLRRGDHVVTTSMEHNAVARSLKALEKKGITTTKVQCSKAGEIPLSLLRKALKPNTRLIVVVHASNVTGTLMPIEEIAQVAKEKGIPLLIDAAQTVGSFRVKVEEIGCDMLAFSGHKALLGPQGVGGLYLSPEIDLEEQRQGGTGGEADSLEQPKIRPDRYESGTPNTPGIAGLGASLKLIEEVGLETISKKETGLSKALMEGLSEISGVTIYGPPREEPRAPIVSINIEGVTSSEAAFWLEEEFDIAVRAGLHCAPAAHSTLGTLESGTIRFSLSYFNTLKEVEIAVEAVRKLSKIKND